MTQSAKPSGSPQKSDALFEGFLQAVAATPHQRIERGGPQEPAPLTSTQQGFWFQWMLKPDETPHNVTKAFRLSGPLDRELLYESINQILRRHDAWRTRISSQEGWPLQDVLPQVDVPLPFHDMRGGQATAVSVEHPRVHAFIHEQNHTPFDLSRAPLLRVSLLQLGESEHLLVLVVHHIVVDGWSIQLFMEELAAHYDALRQGHAADLPPLPIQFADYARWQQEWIKSPQALRQTAYWREKLSDFPQTSTLPPDASRPAVLSNHADHVYRLIRSRDRASFEAFAARENVTLFMLYLSALSTLLYRASGQVDLLIAAPVAGRNHPHTQRLLGCFLNTLVLRMDLAGNPSFRQLLARTRRTVLEAFANQSLTFADLVQVLRPERTLSHAPLFQVMLNHKTFSQSIWRIGDLLLQELNVKGDGTTLDLIVETADYGPDHWCTISYNSQLYGRERIDALQGNFERLLQTIIADPERRVGDNPE